MKAPTPVPRGPVEPTAAKINGMFMRGALRSPVLLSYCVSCKADPRLVVARALKAPRARVLFESAYEDALIEARHSNPQADENAPALYIHAGQVAIEKVIEILKKKQAASKKK